MTDAEMNKAVHKMVKALLEITDEPETMVCMIAGLMLHFTRTFDLPDTAGAEMIGMLASVNRLSLESHCGESKP